MVRKKIVKRFLLGIKLSLIGLVFGSMSVFVFSNSFEVLFSYDIPYVHALETMRSKNVLLSIVDEENPDLFSYSGEKVGNFGSPLTLKIPSFSIRLPLIRASFVRDNWLYKTNNGHYIIKNNSKNGNIGDLVVYTQKSWRTVEYPEDIKIGDNIFIDTDSEWRYMFRISDKSVIETQDSYVYSESPLNTLVLIVEDTESDAAYVYQGKFVSLQNAQH